MDMRVAILTHLQGFRLFDGSPTLTRRSVREFGREW